MDTHNCTTRTPLECHTHQCTDQPTAATAGQRGNGLALCHDVTLDIMGGPRQYSQNTSALREAVVGLKHEPTSHTKEYAHSAFLTWKRRRVQYHEHITYLSPAHVQ